MKGVKFFSDRLFLKKRLWYSASMTNSERNKKLGNLVELKMLEFFGDPDNGLALKKPFVTALRRRLGKKQKLTSMVDVARRYGIR